MSFYDEVGARPFINAGGWMYTRFGGSIMPQPVIAAMAEASRQFVNLFDLQDQVGKAIAAMTNNQAACVSCGAASGLLLCAAAAIAGTDPQMADRLPDSRGMRNQIILRNCQRGTEADAVLRGAGGQLVLVGPPDRPGLVNEIFAAVNDQTAAIVLIGFESETQGDDEEIIARANQRKIAVIVDGACIVPPKQNLWHFTRDLGADAFVTSGGKAIHGPQTTGLVLGKPWIIEACKFHASPNLRLGRGMKVGKEQFAGIYTALKLFLAGDEDMQRARQQSMLQTIADRLNDLGGAKIRFIDDPRLEISFAPGSINQTTEQIAAALLKGDPSILLSGRNGKLTISARLLQDGEEKIVADRLRQVVTVASEAR